MMARCKEQTGGMFKNPPPTQIPSSAHPQKRNGEEKKNTDIWSRYLHSSHSFSRPQLQTYIYLSTHFLFFHLQCPFGSL